MLKIEKDMIAKARKKTLDASSWLTQAKLTELTDSSLTELSDQLREWKETKLIFSVLQDGIELFPAYAFISGKFYPASGLQAILILFAGRKDDWGIAYWFASSNSYLGGKHPQDVLQSYPENVLLAAADELAGVTHG